MAVFAIAADCKALADEWYNDACRYKRVHRKIECLEHAILLFESAENAGYLGCQLRADECRRQLEALRAGSR